jgi:hypothetical protein
MQFGAWLGPYQCLASAAERLLVGCLRGRSRRGFICDRVPHPRCRSGIADHLLCLLPSADNLAAAGVVACSVRRRGAGRTLAGEDEAEFSAFVARDGGQLLGFAFLLVGDRHDAEDLVQQARLRTAGRWSAARQSQRDTAGLSCSIWSGIGGGPDSAGMPNAIPGPGGAAVGDGCRRCGARLAAAAACLPPAVACARRAPPTPSVWFWRAGAAGTRQAARRPRHHRKRRSR